MADSFHFARKLYQNVKENTRGLNRQGRKLQIQVAYNEYPCGMSHVFKGKNKALTHQGLRITAVQCEPGTPERPGCQGHSESCISYVNNTTQKWDFALDGYVIRSTHARHRSRHSAWSFSGWEHTHLQSFDKTLCSLPAHSRAWSWQSIGSGLSMDSDQCWCPRARAPCP